MTPFVPRDARAAELYRLVHRGDPGDVAFYRRFCRDARQVLELGVGYGRIAVELASLGVEVVGVDREPEFLRLAEASARERAVPGSLSLVEGDLTTFALDRTFERVILPHTTFYCLTDVAEARSCLERIREHLEPAGKLGFDVYAADAFHADTEPGDIAADDESPVVGIEFEGEPWTVFERSRWDKPNQRLESTFVYRDAAGHVRHTDTIEQRYWLKDELVGLLAEVGFAAIEPRAGFSKRSDPDRLVVTANRL